MIIYLDQNKWIDVARAIIKPEDNPRFVDVANMIQVKSEKGEWVFPISMVHFLETCARADVGSRTRLAKVMSSLSKNNSIRSFIDLAEIEFINAFSIIHNGKPHINIDAISSNLFNAIGLQTPTIKINDSVPEETQLKMQQIIKENVLENDDLFALLMQNYQDRELLADSQIDIEELKQSHEALKIEFAELPPEYRYKVFLIRSFMTYFELFYKKLIKLFSELKNDIIPKEILA